jgi:isoquinoline 1-oxidoreductase subunit beta
MASAGTGRMAPSRRTLIKGGLALGTGLIVGFRLPPMRGPAARAQAGSFAPNQWVSIDRDGLVTIVNSVVEMGQGSLTTMPAIVADELDTDLGKIRVVQAPANPKLYGNPITGNQSYGGSRGVRDHIEMLRKAGAAAREMLKQAGAQEWGVPVSEVDTDLDTVIHKPTGRRLPYSALVDKASKLPVPQNPTLKTPDKYRYMGKVMHRRDTPLKINGSAVFGMDVVVPGMLIASIERCPVFGGKVKSFDATAAKRIKGVKHVVQVTNGVAVVADSFWTAVRGRQALKVMWDEGPVATVSSASIRQGYVEGAKETGQVARNDGDTDKALAAGAKTVEAIYEVPYLEHACMEPMNATASVKADSCEIWAPTQSPGGTQATGARISGLPAGKVFVNTTYLGGGFGRRGEQDFIVDALETSKAVGAPVKVMWTRPDDIQHGFYRPSTYNVFKAALDAQGNPTAWWNRVVGPGILIQKGRARRAPSTPPPSRACATCPTPFPTCGWSGSTGTTPFPSASGAPWGHRRTASSWRASWTRWPWPRGRIPWSSGRCSWPSPRATWRCWSWLRPRPTGERRSPPGERAAVPSCSPTEATSRTWPRSPWRPTARCGCTSWWGPSTRASR